MLGQCRTITELIVEGHFSNPVSSLASPGPLCPHGSRKHSDLSSARVATAPSESGTVVLGAPAWPMLITLASSASCSGRTCCYWLVQSPERPLATSFVRQKRLAPVDL